MAQTYKYFILYLLFFIPHKHNSIHAHEIEVNEKLSSKIPSDIWLLNNRGDSVLISDKITIPTIISFVYYDCPGICDVMLDETKTLLETNDMLLGIDYQVFTVSIDHNENYQLAAQVKAEVLDGMVKRKQANDHWHFYTGDSLNIRKFTNGLGVGFKAVDEGFIHKLLVVILDSEGTIVRYNMGARLLPMELRLTLAEAEKGNVLPKIYKKDEYCFPAVAPAYARLNSVTVKVAWVMIGMAGLFFVYLLLKTRMLRN